MARIQKRGLVQRVPLNTFYYMNIRGLYPKSNQTKIPMLQDMAHDENLLFLSLTETHLKQDHLDAEVKIENYTIFRADRKQRSHGGAAMYIREEEAATTELLANFSNGTTELLALLIKELDLVLVTMYRPPNTLTHQFQEMASKLVEILRNLPSLSTEVIITGDLNFPSLSWPDMGMAGCTLEERQQASILKKIIEENFLTQCIREPTRGNNILDLVITNSPSMIHSYETRDTIMSDHKMIKVNSIINKQVKPITCPKQPMSRESLADFNFYNKNINWDLVRAELQDTDWQNQLAEPNDVDTLLNTITSKCQEICAKHIPKKNTKKKRNIIPRDRRIMMKRRQTLRTRLRRTTYQPAINRVKQLLEQLECDLKTLIEKEQKAEEEKAISNIKQNPKYFYTYANKKLKTVSKVGPLQNTNRSLTDDPITMANILKTQYESVFSTPKPEKEVTSPTNFFQEATNEGNQLSSITISEEEVIDAIDKIAPDAAAGPDGFHPQFLKRCKRELATPLCTLWSKSLETGTIPEILKTGIITPIHKGGNKDLASQYRPVVLTSHLIKICERVIKSKLVEHLENHNLFNPGQHGFRRGRSCLSQLLAHYDDVLSSIQNGQNADVIYLDFAKAFDKVDHGILLHKLRNCGINGPLGQWLHSFISGRTQRVTVQGVLSEPTIVLSGVPQGSVLGPLLFLIHIADIDASLNHSQATSFADDTRIRKQITTIGDTEQLQEDLSAVLSWSQENNMALNEEKFELLRYGNNQQIIAETRYQCNQQVIKSKEHVKDLGVHMSSDASFSHHITMITETARRMCGWVLRTFRTREEKCMLTLWKTLVLPHLEYCCQLWSPHKVQDIIALEAPQRTFTSRISGVQDLNLNYWERLKYFNLYSVQRRRERYIIIYVWKILEGTVPNTGLQVNHHPRRGRLCYVRTTQGNTQRMRTLVHNSFTYNGTRLFNCLPRELRDLTDITPEDFKRRLDKWLTEVPDVPPTPGYPSSHHNSLPEAIRGIRAEDTGASGGPPQLRH